MTERALEVYLKLARVVAKKVFERSEGDGFRKGLASGGGGSDTPLFTWGEIAYTLVDPELHGDNKESPCKPCLHGGTELSPARPLNHHVK